MIQKPRQPFQRSRVIAAVALLAAAAALGGCAAIGDSAVSAAFVDPSRYDLYDCPRLETERKAIEARTAEINRLIEKAKTGTAGTVVAEMAYRNDYISVRAQARLADKAWVANRCEAGGGVAAPAAAAAPGAVRSGSAVY